VYAREIEGQEFTFGVSGKLIRNVLVMYDRQTGSLWSQLLGEAIDGDMIGASLSFLPSWMMAWDEWKAMHPDTVALDKNGRRGSRDVYESYYASSQAGVIGETFIDTRLNTKQFVIGVTDGAAAAAYPFAVLNMEPVINDQVGERPILVVFNPDIGSGIVFDRRVGDQILTWTAGISSETMIDGETGTVWNLFTGDAVEGPLAGHSLERVSSTPSFWFGWKDFYPHTRIYGIDAPAP
jgi:hypothetical protein